jgi:hypothetical protein
MASKPGAHRRRRKVETRIKVKIEILMYRTITVLALILAAGAAASCGDDDPPTAPTPVPPVEVTEPFSGTLTINGAVTHPFIVQRAGNVTAQLTGLSPDEAAVISLALGTWNGQSCQIIIANDAATLNSAAIGTASAGNFCVRMSDVGRLTAPTDYVVIVRHF